MKVIKTIALLILISSSCSTPLKTISIYDRKYYNEQEAIGDVYYQTFMHGVDSIPLENWITLESKSSDSYLLERMIRCIPNDKTSYRFIYLISEREGKRIYYFKILCDTRENVPAKCNDVKIQTRNGKN